MRLRPADPTDPSEIAAIREVCVAAGADTGGSFDAYLAHVARHGALIVAVAGREVVGVGGVIDLAATAFVTDLFVRPDHHGRGAGGAILGALVDDRPVRTTFSTSHPAALAAYRRVGMHERWPVRYLRGVVAGSSEPRPSPTVSDERLRRLARTELWGHLRSTGAALLALDGGAVAAVRVDPGPGRRSGERVAHVVRVTTGDDTDERREREQRDADDRRRAALALRALWTHLGAGHRVVLHLPDRSAGGDADDADDVRLASLVPGLVEVREFDRDRCCSTLARPVDASLVAVHPGLC